MSHRWVHVANAVFVETVNLLGAGVTGGVQGGGKDEPPPVSSDDGDADVDADMDANVGANVDADVAREVSDEDDVPEVVWKDPEETKMTVIQAAMQAYQVRGLSRPKRFGCLQNQ